jgi:hypothetical protein
LYSRKPDGPVWYFGLSEFTACVLPCPVASQNLCDSRLMCDSLHDQNLQLVLTILCESASAVEPTVHTTPPKVGKADTSSTEVPMVPALVARPGSKASDDTPIDDDPTLLNSIMVASLIACCTSSLLQRYWPDPGRRSSWSS